ncbi:MAG: anhydro-N-acetylmuramic acid kinase [Gammaproteobacteria bacterium]|nr:anhydro-N-acetylmuramic acid kinase [Gammaproteobacteria bacterium]
MPTDCVAQERLYIGQMSGTSGDGIDLALIRVADSADSHAPIALVATDYRPYPTQLADEFFTSRRVYSEQRPADLSNLEQALTRCYIDGLTEFMRREGLGAADITAVGLHGQTIWHSPPLSVQLGDATAVARELSVTTVGDFRQADLRLGGQGAPIMPALHHRLWGHLDGTSVVVNLGGIANVTVFSDHRLHCGFDTGPAGTLTDLWHRRHFGGPYDKNGQTAQRGQVHQPLLEAMLSYKWFAHPPPRSTDQKYFNGAWLDAYLQDFPSLDPGDVLTTLTALSAQTIAGALHLAGVTAADRMIVCGGGAHNQTLLKFLAESFPVPDLRPAADYGYPGDFLEAIGIAWLSHKALQGEPAGIAQLTGASAEAVLGTIHHG